jgi:hypothetical protein
MTSVVIRTAQADRLRLRSSVASKRFPLGDERLARFRFARVFVPCGEPVGPGVPDEFAKADVSVSPELKGEG